MIEFYLQTGNQATGENYQNQGQITNGIGSINSVTPLSNDVYIDGQTFLETTPIVSTVAQRQIITNSGHFFLSGFNLKQGTGFLNLDGFQDANLKFDNGEVYESKFFEWSNSGYITGFSGDAGRTLLSTESMFLNGVKLISGEHYEVDNNDNFLWLDSDNEATGVLFSKATKNEANYTGYYDVIGVMFNKGTSIGYLNGLRIGNSDILETSSILSDIIETGLNDKLEFNSKPDLTTIFL